jgi:ABC-type phosphate transport system ATPase subunit
MGDSIASADLNKGAILRNFNKIVPHAVNAQVHGNVLWSSKPDVPGKIFFTQKNYHIGDINLFYMNIRENVATRIRLFWK